MANVEEKARPKPNPKPKGPSKAKNPRPEAPVRRRKRVPVPRDKPLKEMTPEEMRAYKKLVMQDLRAREKAEKELLEPSLAAPRRVKRGTPVPEGENVIVITNVQLRPSVETWRRVQNTVASRIAVQKGLDVTAFVEKALSDMCNAFEKVYNDGKPFPDLSSSSVPRELRRRIASGRPKKKVKPVKAAPVVEVVPEPVKRPRGRPKSATPAMPPKKPLGRPKKVFYRQDDV